MSPARAPALALLALAAGPALAQATDEQRAALVAAIEAAGCVVTSANAAAIRTAAGLDAPTAESIITGMGAEGLTRRTEAGLRVTSPGCPG